MSVHSRSNSALLIALEAAQKAEETLKLRHGPPGERGPQGERGFMGVRGSQGPEGRRGPQGYHGRDGVDGERGPRGQRGKPGHPGPRGERGERGLTGQTGPRGPEGRQGVQGPAGLNVEDIDLDIDNRLVFTLADGQIIWTRALELSFRHQTSAGGITKREVSTLIQEEAPVQFESITIEGASVAKLVAVE